MFVPGAEQSATNRASSSIRIRLGFRRNASMGSKPSRKQPQQARSKATVIAVLDAMIRILDREGPDAATTTRVAEVAGISIGTLYQYFSDRDSILDALQDREFERAMALVQRVLGKAR